MTGSLPALHHGRQVRARDVFIYSGAGYFTERAQTRRNAPRERGSLRDRGWAQDSGDSGGPLGERGLWYWQNWRHAEAARSGLPQCAGRAGRVKRSRGARKSQSPSVFPAFFFSRAQPVACAAA